MLARNAIVYTLSQEAANSLSSQLESALGSYAFAPCGASDQRSIGFVTFEPKDDRMVRRVQDVAAFSLRIDQKILPGCVVRTETEARLEELEERQGYKPGRKQKKEVKEQVTQELLAKAFIRTTHIRAWFDFKSRLLVVDTSSEAKADDLIGALFKAFNEPIGIQRWQVPVMVSSTLTTWVMGGEAPENFTLDDKALLAGANGARVRLTKQTVTADEVKPLIQSGKDCVEIGMTMEGEMSFTLTDKLILKKLAYVDITDEKEQGAADLLPEELVDAEILISARSLSKVVFALNDSFQGEEMAKAA